MQNSGGGPKFKCPRCQTVHRRFGHCPFEIKSGSFIAELESEPTAKRQKRSAPKVWDSTQQIAQVVIKPDYTCGYCGNHRASASGSSYGPIAMVCDCGGFRQDKIRRKHARWKPRSGVSTHPQRAPVPAPVPAPVSKPVPAPNTLDPEEPVPAPGPKPTPTPDHVPVMHPADSTQQIAQVVIKPVYTCGYCGNRRAYGYSGSSYGPIVMVCDCGG